MVSIGLDQGTRQGLAGDAKLLGVSTPCTGKPLSAIMNMTEAIIATACIACQMRVRKNWRQASTIAIWSLWDTWCNRSPSKKWYSCSWSTISRNYPTLVELEWYWSLVCLSILACKRLNFSSEKRDLTEVVQDGDASDNKELWLFY